MISPSRFIFGQNPSVWVEFSALFRELKPVNLGQSAPDYESATPHHLIENLSSILEHEHQFWQYTRGHGHTALVNVLSKYYGGLLSRKIDAMNEVPKVIVTVGAYGALFYCALGYLNPGDKALIIEPFFDCYPAQTLMATAEPVYIALRPSKVTSVSSSADFQLDFEEFESILKSGGVKLLFLNNPNNPLGKVYTENELMNIAKLAQKFNLLVIADEVYDWLIYPPNRHIRFASLPGMYERTITIGSIGKMFSATGLKIGWAIGPANLLRPLRMVDQNCVYTTQTHGQEAAARSLETEMANLTTDNQIAVDNSYWHQLVDSLQPKRDRVRQIVSEVGMQPILPEAGVFLMADFRNLLTKLQEKGLFNPQKLQQHEQQSRDYEFVRWLCVSRRLACIPCSPFYSPANRSVGERYVRFCFFKDNRTLNAANQILIELKNELL